MFADDLVARTSFGSPAGGLWDRQGKHWLVIDVDGTKQAARQRALPQTKDLPAPHRRFERVCAKGYFGRKRGQVGRTRTTVLQPFTHQWIGTFAGAGNGDYREALRHALQAITAYATACDGVRASPVSCHRARRRLVWKHGPGEGDALVPVWGDWTEQGVELA